MSVGSSSKVGYNEAQVNSPTEHNNTIVSVSKVSQGLTKVDQSTSEAIGGRVEKKSNLLAQATNNSTSNQGLNFHVEFEKCRKKEISPETFLNLIKSERPDPETALNVILMVMSVLDSTNSKDQDLLNSFKEVLGHLIDCGADVNRVYGECEYARTFTSELFQRIMLSIGQAIPGMPDYNKQRLNQSYFTEMGLDLFEQCVKKNADVRKINWVFNFLDLQVAGIKGVYFPMTHFDSLPNDMTNKTVATVLKILKLILKHSNDLAVKKQMTQLSFSDGSSIVEVAKRHDNELFELLSSVLK